MNEITAILDALDPSLTGILDYADLSVTDREAAWRMTAHLVCVHFQAVQTRLAQQLGGGERDYEFTVAGAIGGQRWIGLFRVGDCVAVARSSGAIGLVFPEKTGRYIHDTDFIGPAFDSARDLQTALIPIAATRGVGVMSDGMAADLLDMTRARPRETIGLFLEACAQGSLERETLVTVLEQSLSLARTSDDRAIAILVRTVTA